MEIDTHSLDPEKAQHRQTLWCLVLFVVRAQKFENTVERMFNVLETKCRFPKNWRVVCTKVSNAGLVFKDAGSKSSPV